MDDKLDKLGSTFSELLKGWNERRSELEELATKIEETGNSISTQLESLKEKC